MSKELPQFNEVHIQQRFLLPSLEEFINDDTKVSPEERTSFIFGIYMGDIVADLSMESLKSNSFCNRKYLRPSKKGIIVELTRRNAGVKNLPNLPIRRLIELLEKTKNSLSESDVNFVTKRYNTLYKLLSREQIEKNDVQSTNITFVDRIRFIHCLIVDEVEILYLKSQNSMLRSELDARNSDSRIPTFHQKIVSVFNDSSFEPESVSYNDLHEDFSSKITLKLTKYRLTIEKSKEMLTTIKPMIVDIITRYEQSGMGADNRDYTENDWDKFDIALCDNGDDRKSF